ncbi:MAG TPA: tricarballylate utilization 4Fe-4S protein TcuB [Thermodesulfobacteriota bacterium]|nr:tricarballylate utilization 4Fe-4S protein TcuB [Thermodesulfobacteriota bacterium]
MPDAERLREAARQMTVCNACRYCEGFCAVFPAMERRRRFAPGDLVYLANLCFDCRACYYACPYAPPHEFAINLPRLFSALRADVYRDYTWPRILARLAERGVRTGAVASAAGVVAAVLLVLLLRGPSVVFATHPGEGAFYRVVPYLAMALPALAFALYGGAALAVGAVRFWRDTHGRLADLLDRRSLWRATADAFGLRYLGGGGGGCPYPGERASHGRRWLHHLVFYGFLLDLASTTVAAIYDHLLGWRAPYPLLSWPVVLGTVGGAMLVVGTAGLLWLKWRSDRAPAEERMVGMDVAFLAVLGLTSLTGLLLLALRDTAAMGTLLAIHLGMVAAFFVTLPYSKFAHVAYRYAALVRNAIEERRAGRAAP